MADIVSNPSSVMARSNFNGKVFPEYFVLGSGYAAWSFLCMEKHLGCSVCAGTWN